MPTIQALQALRAIAAWLVVYHHYMQMVHHGYSQSPVGAFFVQYGLVGVDVFFIISGFIMYYSLTLKPRTAQAFLLARIRRIVPVYWVYTGLAIMAANLVKDQVEYVWTYRSLIQSLLFIPHQNPTGIGEFPLLTVGWTLNFEMFFYSVLTLNLQLFRRYAFIVTAMVLLLLPMLWPTDWFYAGICTSKRLNEFSLGILLGYLYVKTPLLRNPNYGWLAAIASILLLAVVYWMNQNAFQAYALLLVLSALGLERLPNWRHWFFNALLKLGDMSYSTYLAHAIILFLLNSFISQPASALSEVLFLFTLTILVYILSFLSFQGIERGWLLDRLTRLY
ncbi:MAG: acyltransferase [Methylococcales bacterium]